MAHIPECDAQRLPGLIRMSTSGAYRILPAIDIALQGAREQVERERTERKQKRLQRSFAGKSRKRARLTRLGGAPLGDHQ